MLNQPKVKKTTILISLKYQKLKNTPDHLINKNKDNEDLPITIKFAPTIFHKTQPTCQKTNK